MSRIDVLASIILRNAPRLLKEAEAEAQRAATKALGRAIQRPRKARRGGKGKRV
jgi:hypothetical protein